LKWVVIVGLAAGALAVGLYATSGPRTSAPGTQPSVGSPVWSATPAPPASQLVLPQPKGTAAEVPGAPPLASVLAADTAVASGHVPNVDAAPRGSAPGKEARAPGASVPAAPLGLAGETAILDRARSALGRGDPRGALAELDRYDAAPAPKILGQEATMVRIEALSAKGDAAAARALARGFLAKNPGSTYDDRVRALIAEPKQP
jgi:hypothetical protein